MGHSISAIIAKAPIKESVASQYDLPVFIENGFAIIGLDSTHSDFWTEKLHLNLNRQSKIILDNGTTHFFAKELGMETFAIIFTAYFGGIGEQYATVYHNDELIVEGTINQALKAIGVKVLDGRDEFDTINLSKYRRFDDYFEKY